jgi:fructose-bisphosphate aldolase, class II
MDDSFAPIPGSTIFNALRDRPCIVMASNIRIIPGVMKGLFRAAKDSDSAALFEIARSESNLDGGYIGMTPADYGRFAMETAQEVGYDIWGLHADHITIKKGTDEDLAATRELISNQVDGGFTSFAIDASHLFNFEGGDLREELAHNIDCTTQMAQFIQERMGDKQFGLEVEVGEIGRADGSGMVLTRPEEGVAFITALRENGVEPHVLAIANGTAHGNVYDAAGNLIEDISIDIAQTKAVTQALRDNNLAVRIAQHGITGTPRDKIATMFPMGDIIKGNVATFWQNLAFDTIKIYHPDLYQRMWDWVQETKGTPDKKPIEIFGKNAKFACGHFYDELNSLPDETVHAIEAMAYAEGLLFFRAFNAYGTGSIVREYMKQHQ